MLLKNGIAMDGLAPTRPPKTRAPFNEKLAAIACRAARARLAFRFRDVATVQKNVCIAFEHVFEAVAIEAADTFPTDTIGSEIERAGTMTTLRSSCLDFQHVQLHHESGEIDDFEAQSGRC